MSQTSSSIVPPSAASRTETEAGFARRRMVDTQIRPVQVSDPRIIEAMRTLPRERFVPADRAVVAYMDQDVPLGHGRVLTEPRVIARLVQVLVPRRGERALVVAAGTGYAACLLAALGVEVVALEQNQTLADWGRRLTAELAPGISYRTGALAQGCAEAGPYQLILIDGAVREIPGALAAQLAPAGRVAGVLARAGRVPTGFLAEASGKDLSIRPHFDAATPLLPELAPAPGFSFAAS